MLVAMIHNNAANASVYSGCYHCIAGQIEFKCTPETALKVMLDKQLNFVDAVIEHVWYCASCPLSQFPYSASAEILRRLPLLSACVFSCVVTPGGLVVLKRFGFN